MMLLMNVAWSRRPIFLSATTILIATLSACDRGPTAPSSAAANLVVQLTDAPVQWVEQIHLVFTTVTAKPVGGPPETLVSACDRGPTAPSSAAANLVVQLTDAPVQWVEQIHLVFTTVTAKPVGGPPETLVLGLDPGESLDIFKLRNRKRSLPSLRASWTRVPTSF